MIRLIHGNKAAQPSLRALVFGLALLGGVCSAFQLPAGGDGTQAVAASSPADAGSQSAAQVLNPNLEERSPRAAIDIPDPATPWLLGIGLIGISLLRRRRKAGSGD